MALLEGKTPAERRQLLILAVLGSIAVLGILYNYVFSNSKPKRTTRAAVSQTKRAAGANTTTPVRELRSLQAPRPIVYQPASYVDPNPGRNIFAYYSGTLPRTGGNRVATTAGSPVTEETPVIEPTATPTPPPPLILSGVSPASVYARTGDFTLEIAGDKFTPATRAYLSGSELPTTFVSPQQLRAQVSASGIASEGGRSILVRTPDNSLYSNTLSLNVMSPPAPPFTYVGLLGRTTNKDTAVLKNNNGGGDLISVQRGDPVGGRFRVTDISERAIELTDSELRIKHTLKFVDPNTTRSSSQDPLNRQRNISPQPIVEDPDEDN